MEEKLFDENASFECRQWGERNPVKMSAVIEFVQLKLDWNLQWSPSGGKAWHPWVCFAMLLEEWQEYRLRESLDEVCDSYFYFIMKNRFDHIRFTHKGDFRQCDLCFDSNYEMNVAIEEKSDANQKDVFLLKTTHVEALRGGHVISACWRGLGDAFPEYFHVLQGDRGDTHKFWMPSKMTRCGFNS